MKKKQLTKKYLDFIYTTRNKNCYGKKRKVIITFNKKLYDEKKKTFIANYQDAIIEIEEEVKKYNKTKKNKKGRILTLEELEIKLNKK